MNMIKLLAVTILISCVATADERTEILLPDIPGYHTLKCDFHMHTVYSDGSVFPNMRVREAWANGLDAITITEHVEHLNREGDVDKSDMNRSFELGKYEADRYHIMLIRGTEITRDVPHGHFNAVGISDANPMSTPDNAEAVRLANEQGAVVFWNHPPALWSSVQKEYLTKGLMHGIEVFNGDTYYPHSFKWCLEHGLTLLSNTDVHGLVSESYNPAIGKYRNMTLVFAETNTEEGVLDALRSGRTIAYWNNILAGRTELVAPFFEACIDVLHPEIALKPKGSCFVGLRNRSSISFELESNGRVDNITPSRSIVLPAGKTVMMTLEASETIEIGQTKELRIPYIVKNVWVGSEKQGLEASFTVQITFVEK